MNKTLRASIIILTLVSVAFVLIYIFGPDKYQWVKDISINLSTEIIGILLTVLLIDRILQRYSEIERKKYQKIAFQQLKLPLVNFLQTLCNMYKASITEKPTNFIENLDDFFSDDYFKQLAFLDFSNPAPIYGPFQWFDYLAQESIKFKDSLNRTVEKYSVHLSPETVEILEQILNSNLISFLQLTPVVRDLDNKEGFKREYNFFADEGMVDMLRENTDLIIKLINEYNENSGAETKITITSELWRNDISPKVGSSRKAMPNKANSHGKN